MGWEYRCAICDKLLFIEEMDKTKRFEEYEKIVVGLAYKGAYAEYGADEIKVYLCRNCYIRFKDMLANIKAKISKTVRIYDIEFLEFRNIIFYNPKSLIEFLENHVEYASEPKEMAIVKDLKQIRGIGIYAKPKNPLEKPYRILLPYLAIINYIKTSIK